MYLHALRAGHVSARAGHVFACVGTYQELSESVCVSMCTKLVMICMCWPVLHD